MPIWISATGNVYSAIHRDGLVNLTPLSGGISHSINRRFFRP